MAVQRLRAMGAPCATRDAIAIDRRPGVTTRRGHSRRRLRALAVIPAFFALALALALAVAYAPVAGADPSSDGLDASALRGDEIPAAPAPEWVEATDGARLAVFPYRATDPGARLVFYHGGGAHSLAGYQSLALTLSRVHGISTYLVDIRGHGRSDGDRGDAPSAEQVWMDVDSVLASVDRESTGALVPPLLVGGHSSGAGLVLNAMTRDDAPAVDAVVFVAPELGPSADTKHERPDAFRFADVQVWKFVCTGSAAASSAAIARRSGSDIPTAPKIGAWSPGTR